MYFNHWQAHYDNRRRKHFFCDLSMSSYTYPATITKTARFSTEKLKLMFLSFNSWRKKYCNRRPDDCLVF